MRHMGFQDVWVWVPLSCVALSKCLSCSEPHFLHLGNRCDHICHAEGCGEARGGITT